MAFCLKDLVRFVKNDEKEMFMGIAEKILVWALLKPSMLPARMTMTSTVGFQRIALSFVVFATTL